ncbi:hypothetical protein A2210_00370 [Candidatus Woesebacteria bacterium RIFOXYA1_FULL_40_18]|uniref:Thioredoxin domain-containing protein n=3 Tax=Candidatus Woeseibacteriota TaxID=1752722 RepID=A0A0G0VJG8_9BACT|nr:MAG: hypothetical protein UU03_C0020G0005 [Candidatus Woesebacteria bacterium GW2011_GWA1_40_45]OGM75538.1 MAG: hypothetical protein A2210_00370 [Candidatus Woesebacteria bacterium RIFOXYA1_FULL_40_18]OGM79883.1 MAG: hypothetical protein A2361_02220 [Candidatus Woesebacteria bacterium RIFOXYB1_FULL_40_26]
MKNKFGLIAGGVTLLIIFGGVFLFSRPQSQTSDTPLPTAYEYFWGDGCPHCAIVEEFLNSWEGKDKIAIDKKEVWNNRENASLLNQRVKSCSLNLNEVGVPFLFTPEGKCITGDTPIIDFFKSL